MQYPMYLKGMPTQPPGCRPPWSCNLWCMLGSQTHPTEWQTHVNHYLAPNFVCGGWLWNYRIHCHPCRVFKGQLPLVPGRGYNQLIVPVAVMFTANCNTSWNSLVIYLLASFSSCPIKAWNVHVNELNIVIATMLDYFATSLECQSFGKKTLHSSLRDMQSRELTQPVMKLVPGIKLSS